MPGADSVFTVDTMSHDGVAKTRAFTVVDVIAMLRGFGYTVKTKTVYGKDQVSLAAKIDDLVTQGVSVMATPKVKTKIIKGIRYLTCTVYVTSSDIVSELWSDRSWAPTAYVDVADICDMSAAVSLDDVV